MLQAFKFLNWYQNKTTLSSLHLLVLHLQRGRSQLPAKGFLSPTSIQLVKTTAAWT